MSALLPFIQSHITHSGPITLADYMGICLGHPQLGYYQHQQPFGRTGDFITAPELTPLFGEMIGVWIVDTWDKMGQPYPFQLIECGPGTGILMSDALRVVQKLAAPLMPHLQVHLVETSDRLRKIQAEALAQFECKIEWHDTLDAVPLGTSIIIANEFFDALPIHQYERRENTWGERCIGLNASGALELQLQPRVQINYPFPDYTNKLENGAFVESCPAAQGVIDAIFKRFEQYAGAALIIDYGYYGPATGDSFQALRGHEYVNPLEHAGEADLTAHVDFGALALWANACEAVHTGFMTQGEFLQKLGILLRLERILPTLSLDKQVILSSSVQRLIDPNQMGDLFKVLCIFSKPLTPEPFTP